MRRARALRGANGILVALVAAMTAVDSAVLGALMWWLFGWWLCLVSRRRPDAACVAWCARSVWWAQEARSSAQAPG